MTETVRANAPLEYLIPKRIELSKITLDRVIQYHTSWSALNINLISKLEIINKTTPLKDLSIEKIGEIGEKACFRFLSEYYLIKGTSSHNPPQHCNSAFESYKPYDITYKQHFIDVKTTKFKESNFFHVSLPEAHFITEHYSDYYFARVFPLHENESYVGIQITDDLGMNIFKLKAEVKEEFNEMVSVMARITGGEGFLLKPEWLKNIHIKSCWDLAKYFDRYKREDRSINWKLDHGSKLRPVISFYLENSIGWPYEIKILEDISLNYKIHELFYLINTLMTYRENPVTFRLKGFENKKNKLADHWQNEDLKLFLMETLENKISNHVIFVFLLEILQNYDKLTISQIIINSKKNTHKNFF